LNKTLNLAISILIHESSSFFELQCQNIRYYYPSAKIVVHVGESLWYTQKKRIREICLKYNVIINPGHIKTMWATPSLFEALLSNMNIIKEQTEWSHYIFLASNELFVSGLLESKCAESKLDSELPIIWDSYSDVTPLDENERDRVAVAFDTGLKRFIDDTGFAVKTGLDFGRIISKGAFDNLIQLLNKYWKFQVIPTVSYSQSEVVLPTLIEYLASINKIVLVKNLIVSTWITNYNSNHKEDFIIVKKIPRDKHNPIVKSIMISNGVFYPTTIFHMMKSFAKNNYILSRLYYKKRDFFSLIYKKLDI
jgi:hypothetical protein